MSRNSTRFSVVAGGALACLLVGLAPAGATVLNFDTVTTGSPGPDVWSPDRQAPAGFASTPFLGDNRLALTLSSSDYKTDLFYDTQGRSYSLDPGTQYLSVQLYVTQAMKDSTNRVTGLWGQAADPNNTPVIELADGHFRGWDEVNGTWSNLTTASGADQWYTLAISHTGSNYNYYVNGVLFGSVSDGGAVSLVNVILQGENGLIPGTSSSTGDGFGTSATYYYDNLTFAAAAPTPLPAALPLFLSGLGGLGVVALRRRSKKWTA